MRVYEEWQHHAQGWASIVLRPDVLILKNRRFYQQHLLLKSKEKSSYVGILK